MPRDASRHRRDGDRCDLLDGWDTSHGDVEEVICVHGSTIVEEVLVVVVLVVLLDLSSDLSHDRVYFIMLLFLFRLLSAS